MHLQTKSATYTVYLGALSAIPPLSVDMSLPAVQQTSSRLHAGEAITSLALSLFLVGFAVAPLVLGPLSDRFGRRPILLVGLTVFTVASALCAGAQSIGWLLLARFVEGMGAGAGAVLPMAIVRDVFEGAAARTRLALITLILSVAPVIAPSLGTLILLAADWRTIYAILALGGCGLLGVTWLGLAETHTVRHPAPLHPMEVLRRYRDVLANRATLGFSLVNGFSFACMFAFITASPLVFMTGFGLGEAAYSGFFFTAGLGTIAGSAVAGRLGSGRWSGKWAIRASALAGSGTTLLAVVVCLTGLAGTWTLLPLLFLSNACYGLIGPHASHEALVPMGSMAGIASAVLRSSQMFLGAVAGGMTIALAPIGPALGMSLTMLIAALASLLSIRLAARA